MWGQAEFVAAWLLRPWMQWLGRAFKNFGSCSVPGAIDDEAFFVESIFAEEDFSQSVAVHVHRVNQLKARCYVEMAGIGDVHQQLLRIVFQINARHQSDVARYRRSRRRGRRSRTPGPWWPRSRRPCKLPPPNHHTH